MRRNVLYIGILVALVAWLNLFFYNDLAGTGTGLLLMGLILLVLASYQIRGGKISLRKAWVIAGGYCFFLLWVLMWRATNIVLMGAVLALLGMLLYLNYLNAVGSSRIRAYFELIAVPFRSIYGWMMAFGKWPKMLYQDVNGKSVNKPKWQLLLPILTGIVIGIPLIVVLILLLSNADPIFSSKVQELTDFNVSERLIARITLSAIAVVLFGPVLAMKLKKNYHSPLKRTFRDVDLIAVNTVLVMVLIVLGAFLLIQWPYVFARVAAETDLSQFGVATYSEYVTRGFGELILVAGLIYLLLGIHLIVWRGVRKRSSWGKLIALALAVVFGVFLVSVFRRVYLYQVHHGMSLIRVYGSLFLLGIAGMGMMLVGRYVKKIDWIRWEMVFAAGMLVLVGIWNVENMIAVSNPPTVNGQVDYVYLSRMSADGYEGWVEAFDWVEKVVSGDMASDGVIDADERRELAYGGMILGNLDEHRWELIEGYGTDEEKLDLYQHNLEKKKKIIQIQSYASADGVQGSEISWLREEYDHAATDSAKLNLTIVEEGRVKTRRHRYYGSSFNFYLTTTCQFTACIQGFVVDRVGGNVIVKETWWQRLLVWNKAGWSAYGSWPEDISAEEWKRVTSTWLELYAQVLRQEDKDYEKDISVSSPLL